MAESIKFYCGLIYYFDPIPRCQREPYAQIGFFKFYFGDQYI